MASPLQRLQGLGSRLKAGLGTTLIATSSCALGLGLFSAPTSAALTGSQKPPIAKNAKLRRSKIRQQS